MSGTETKLKPDSGGRNPLPEKDLQMNRFSKYLYYNNLEKRIFSGITCSRQAETSDFFKK
jgi:hypothetical protein